MGFIQDPNPPIESPQALRILIAGSVGIIGYQVDGFAALGVVTTIVEVIMSKPASWKEID